MDALGLADPDQHAHRADSAAVAGTGQHSRLRLPTAGTDAARVNDYLQANPTLGPWLDRLGMFDVFASAWFAAIYLLLCISLVGCIIPGPPTSSGPTANPAASALAVVAHARVHHRQRRRHDSALLDDAEAYLRDNRWRVRRDGDAISAEKGYLHEVGNLLFHLCFIFLLLAVGVGGLFGWSARVIVVEGKGFTGSLTQFDLFRKGRLVNPDQIAPFSVVLQDFSATFQESGQQAGSPRQFEARALVSERPGKPVTEQEFQVNSPLVLPGVKVF